MNGATWQLAHAHTGMVCALAVAADGTPWIGGCGSLHYSWGKLTHGQGDGWVEEQAGTIRGSRGARHSLWTRRHDCRRHRPGTEHRRRGGWHTLRAGPTLNQVTAVAVTPDGAAWFGFGDSASDAAGGGLSRFDGREWLHFLADANVQALAVGPDGVLWAGAGCTLWRFEAGNWRQVGGCDEIKGNVLDIAPASDGTVWVATGLSLARFDPSAALRTGGRSWTTVDRLAHSVAVAPGDTLWAAGWGGDAGLTIRCPPRRLGLDQNAGSQPRLPGRDPRRSGVGHRRRAGPGPL